MLRAVRGWVDDHIAARRVEPAIGLVGELRIAQRQSGLQRDIPEFKDLVIA
jgi:hypothetical protein